MARRFDHLADVEALLSVVEQGSLTNAAVVLGTTASVLSRAIARLEARLGTQLLRRTTRSQSLTDAGRLYVDEARQAFALVEKAEQAICGSTPRAEVTGRVRLSVPTSYGHCRLPPVLAEFARRHPHAQVELNITNRNVDMAAEGYDLAIRSGPLPDSSMVARKLEDGAMVLVASPAYVRDAGPLETFDDLQRQRCIAFVRPSTGRIIPWLLRVDGNDVDWQPAAPAITVSDDVMGVVTLAAQGLGIAICAELMAARELEAGRLVRVLPALAGRTRAFSLVYAPHRGLSPPARALIALLVEHAGERPGPAAQRPPASPA